MAVPSEKIKELAIIMHEKKSNMQNLHDTRQSVNAGAWTAENEADYQISRAEYYEAKNALERVVNGSETI